jgi:integrase
VGKKLAAVTLKTLRAGMHSDGGGLYLCVQDSGSRSWILRTTIKGVRREIGLGSLTTRSLAEARLEAASLQARISRGEDVLESRRVENRRIPTFNEAALAYHRQISATFDSEQHQHNWLRSLEQYIIPVFGSKPVDEIEPPDVLRAIGTIWNTVPDTARRTLRRVSAIFDNCQAAGYRNVLVNGVTVPMPNPCDTIRAALPKHNGTEKHREALPYPQLPHFIQRLRTSQSALSVKLAFEFKILSCSRTNEVLGTKWDEISIADALWIVPATRMKMKVEHKVPLSPRCVEILAMAKEFNDGEIVFPGRLAGQPLSNMAFLMSLRRMGYETLTGDGFRATFKTWAEETTDFDTLVIEASMAHAVKGIERHYLRTTFFEHRKMLMDAWANYATNAPLTKRSNHA